MTNRGAVLLVVLLVAGCGSPAPVADAGGSGAGSMCLRGELGPCRCADGRVGLRVCGADAGPGEIWGPCDCP